MENCISFNKTVKAFVDQKSDSSVWSSARKLFDNKEYLKSFYETLNYIDNELITKYGNADKTEFQLPQGSVIITLKLADNKINISAPFVKIPKSKYIPIFRKCTELNFKIMTLPQIVIKDNCLVFEYSMPLETCEPYKLYSVLRDIAQNADRYDDEFVEKYGAERIIEPMITHYDDNKLSQILDTCKAIAKEALDYISYYEEKRRFTNACDALYVGLKRIDYYCEPSGTFYNKLADCLNAMFDKKNDMLAKLKPGKQFLSSIQDITLDSFRENVFVSYSVIPLKASKSRNQLEKWIERDYNYNKKLYNDNDIIGSTWYSMYTLYTMLANFNMDDNSVKAIEYSLNKAAGKSWKEASVILLDVIDFFFQNNKEKFNMPGGEVKDPNEQANKSIFSSLKSLFGKK